jgi:hypothetical protein
MVPPHFRLRLAWAIFYFFKLQEQNSPGRTKIGLPLKLFMTANRWHGEWQEM